MYITLRSAAKCARSGHFVRLQLLVICLFMRIIVRTNNAHKEFIMSHVFDSSAVKKPTNLTVNSDLLFRARKLNINLSATLEKALVAELKNAEKQSWLKKNKKAISALNNFSEKNGLFSDSYRKL